MWNSHVNIQEQEWCMDCVYTHKLDLFPSTDHPVLLFYIRWQCGLLFSVVF